LTDSVDCDNLTIESDTLKHLTGLEHIDVLLFHFVYDRRTGPACAIDGDGRCRQRAILNTPVTDAAIDVIARTPGTQPADYATRTLITSGTENGDRSAALEIIRLLKAAGADPSIKNKSGRRPVDYVKDENIKALLERPKRNRS
jgi:hypothetical protein